MKLFSGYNMKGYRPQVSGGALSRSRYGAPQLVVPPFNPLTSTAPVAPGVTIRRNGGEGRRQPRPGTPIMLYASGTIQPNSPGSVNTSALRNPTGSPILVEEISFASLNNPLNAVFGDTNLDGVGNSYFGAILYVSLQITRHNSDPIPLTGNYIPLWGFGEGPTDPGAAVYKWRLSTPLLLGPGETLEPMFLHKGFINTAQTVGVSLSGYVREKTHKPHKATYPYVTSYNSKTLDPSTADTDSSTEDDLSNPFDAPLHVTRFTGHHFLSGVTSTPTNFIDEIMTMSYTGSNPPTSVIPLVRMVSSDGEQLVPQFTNFRTVFSPATRSWEVTYDVQPKSYVQAFISSPNGTYAFGSATLITVGHQIHITMVGEREITL